MFDVKSIFLSKTFWVACVTFLAGLAVLVQNTFPNQSWVGYAIMAKSLLDIALRLITTQPVSITGSVNPPSPIV